MAGTLALVKSWGLTNLELAGTYGHERAGLRRLAEEDRAARDQHACGFQQLSDGMDGVIADARTFGVQANLGCAWIPHGYRFTAADADKAVRVFNAAGTKARAAGLRFFYHIHGYEFQPAPEGTLFDAIATRTDPALVGFEMDIFWAVRGGASPVDLSTRYPDRFPLTHLKDMRKGTAVGDPTGHAPDDSNVPLGDGSIEWTPIFRAANKAGNEVPLHRGRSAGS